MLGFDAKMSIRSLNSRDNEALSGPIACLIKIRGMSNSTFGDVKLERRVTPKIELKNRNKYISSWLLLSLFFLDK